MTRHVGALGYLAMVVAMVSACGPGSGGDPSCNALLDAVRNVGLANQRDLDAIRTEKDMGLAIVRAEQVQERLREFLVSSENLGVRKCQMNGNMGSTFQVMPEDLERARVMLSWSAKELVIQIQGNPGSMPSSRSAHTFAASKNTL